MSYCHLDCRCTNSIAYKCISNACSSQLSNLTVYVLPNCTITEIRLSAVDPVKTEVHVLPISEVVTSTTERRILCQLHNNASCIP